MNLNINQRLRLEVLCKDFENLAISYNDARYLLEHEKKNIQDIIQTMGLRTRRKSSGKSMQNCEIS